MYISQIAAGVDKIYLFLQTGSNSSRHDVTACLDENGHPFPTFVTYATMSRLIEGAVYAGQANLGEGNYGYLFARGQDFVLAVNSISGTREVNLDLGVPRGDHRRHDGPLEGRARAGWPAAAGSLSADTVSALAAQQSRRAQDRQRGTPQAPGSPPGERRRSAGKNRGGRENCRRRPGRDESPLPTRPGRRDRCGGQCGAASQGGCRRHRQSRPPDRRKARRTGRLSAQDAAGARLD